MCYYCHSIYTSLILKHDKTWQDLVQQSTPSHPLLLYSLLFSARTDASIFTSDVALTIDTGNIPEAQTLISASVLAIDVTLPMEIHLLYSYEILPDMPHLHISVGDVAKPNTVLFS